jgi:hypothetical protein
VNILLSDARDLPTIISQENFMPGADPSSLIEVRVLKQGGMTRH